MIAKAIIYFGQPCVVACDARCDKAWGINSRPRVEFDPDDPDDHAMYADGELARVRTIGARRAKKAYRAERLLRSSLQQAVEA